MVVVFGSINLDLVARVPHFPQPGETLAAHSFATYSGGKGGNQALAAARAGASVTLVGAVGRDEFAETALAELHTGNVDLSQVRTVDGPTGLAIITVTDVGENAIVVAVGANAHVDADDVLADWLQPSTVLVLQQEVPGTANAQLAARASKSGARIVLNAAPAREVDADLLDLLDVIVVNETEMRALATDHRLPDEPAAFAAVISQRHGLVAVVTLGAAGVLAADNGAIHTLPAPPVTVVDSTGAGDAFVGALAAALERDCPLTTALTWAVAAGSLACTRHGAQPSLPTAAEVDALLPPS